MRGVGKGWRLAGVTVSVVTAAAAGVGMLEATTGTARAASPPLCRTSQLEAWWGMPGSGTAGGTYYELQLSNVSSTSCRLRGFPGVVAVDGNGHALGSPARWDPAVHPVGVVLGPQATAHTVLRVTDVGVYPPTTCRPVDAAGLNVIPPDQTTATLVPFPLRACSAAGPAYLSVRAIQPGAGIPGIGQ